MASARLVLQRYAVALYQLAHEHGTTEQVEAELMDLDAMLAADVGLREHLANPRLGRDVKHRILLQLMGARVSDLLRRTVLLLVDKGRAGLLPEFAEAFNEVAMKASGREVAQVTSAVPLDEAGRRALRERLERLTGKRITLSEAVDGSLLGGLRVVLGSRMIDGSLRRRLQDIEQKMLRAPLGRRS